MPHVYVLLEYADALTNGQMANVRLALADMISSRHRDQEVTDYPPYLAQARFEQSGKVIIAEGNFDNVAKSTFVQHLASRLGLSELTVRNKLAVAVMGGNLATWAQSRQEAAEYLRANIEYPSYYVATTGDDANAGSQASPFRTISYAISTVPVGSIIIIRAGEYAEYLNIRKSITLKAFPGETVTIKPNSGIESSAVLILANDVLLHSIIIDGVNRKRGVDIASAQRVTLNRCEIKNCVGQSSGQYGQGVIATNDGITRDICILNTTIHHINGVSGEEMYCHAIYSSVAGMIVRGCEIYGIGSHGIHFYGGAGGDLLAEGNYIHDCLAGIGIYVGNAEVYNNVIRNTTQALTARYDARNVAFANNTLIRDTVGSNTIGIDVAHLADGANVKALNNVLHTGVYSIRAEQTNASTGVFSAHHNLRSAYTQADPMIGHMENYSISKIDATFTPVTDDSGANIKPTSGNPAKAAGIAMSEVTADYGGNARSNPPTIGAWE